MSGDRFSAVGTPAPVLDADAADQRSASQALIDAAPTELRPGLWSIPVAIPIVALKIVNVYVVEHPDRTVTLLDSGWDDRRSMQTLEDGLTLIGHRIEDIAAVVVTHAHPDHLGLAHTLRQRSGARILVHEREAERLALPPSMPDRFRTAVYDRFPRWGVPADRVASMVSAAAPTSVDSWTVPVEPLRDGERLDVPGWNLRVVWTPGHTPGHLCIHDPDAGLLFTGDHVLPRITPGVGSHPAEPGDALGDFLDSLRRVAALPVESVLPGHEYRFGSLSDRVRELTAHHDRRLDEVESVVRTTPGVTGWEVTRRIGWSRPLERFGAPMIRAAVAETVAHLVHLELLGRLRRTVETTDEQPVERWAPC